MQFKSDRIFNFFNYTFLILISLTMIAPLIHLLAVSLSEQRAVDLGLVTFFPHGLNFDVYRTIFDMNALWRSMGVTIYITVVGTIIALILTSMLAYTLSRPRMPGRVFFLRAVVITFIFSAPLIPTYLVIRATGIENTLWALMIPQALSAFNIIIMKTFFQGLSSEVFDAAKIDGCSEWGIYTRIALPMSTAVIATIALFQAVTQWNSYFAAIIYIRDRDLFPLQVLLRGLVVEDDFSQTSNDAMEMIQATPEMMKAGIILFATLPILLFYPFLQRYFVKGATLGSLKE